MDSTSEDSDSVSRATRTLDLTKVDENQGSAKINVTFSAQIRSSEPSNPLGLVEILVKGDNRTITVAKKESGGQYQVSADISQFAGQEVTVEVVARGDATIKVSEIEVIRDSDGDSIRDVAELTTQRRPMDIFYVVENEDGQPTGESLELELDPHDADTNGDGLSDGKQVEFSVMRNDRSDGIIGFTVKKESVIAHPNKKNTDEVGLSDREEIAEGSNPLNPQRIIISVQYPVQAEEAPEFDDMEHKPQTVGNDKLLTPVDKWKVKGDDPRRRPPWLPESVEVDYSYTYYQIPIIITINHRGLGNPEEAIPNFIKFSIYDNSNKYKFEIIDGNQGLHIAEDLEEGVNERNITLRVQDVDQTEEGDIGDPIKIIELGKIEASPNYDDSSPYDRIEDMGIKSESMKLLDFGTIDATKLAQYSFEELRKGFLQVMKVTKVMSVAKLAIRYIPDAAIVRFFMPSPPETELGFAANIYRANDTRTVAGKDFTYGGPMITIAN